MLGVQRAQGVVGLEHWDEACVGAGWPQGSSLVGKCDEDEGGLQRA